MSKSPKIAELSTLSAAAGRLPAWLRGSIEKILGFSAINKRYALMDAERRHGSTESFFRLSCKHLPLRYEATGIEHIPSTGPCVVVSNHPHGMTDGLILGDILTAVRPDVKILLTDYLGGLPELQPYCISVNVYGGNEAARKNVSALREMLKWLKDGHCLLIFPSGEASTWSWKERRITDSAWKAHIANIIRKTEACVVPVHLFGRTSLRFQVASVFGDVARLLLFVREFIRDSKMQHKVTIGAPLSSAAIKLTKDDTALAEYLRICSTLLAKNKHNALCKKQHTEEAIAPHPPQEQLQAEIDALPASALYVDNKSEYLQVYAAQAGQIPAILREISILREETFRAVQEGTGKSADSDSFDNDYLHIFLWDKNQHRVAGAYRLGRIDLLLQKEQGLKNVYNAAFFDFSPALLHRLQQGIELGRAFICADYQRRTAALDTLWMGIGHFLHQHPQYRYLYGTVSISQSYSPASRALILHYLQQHCMLNDSECRAKAHTPPHHLNLHGADVLLIKHACTDLALLSHAVKSLENNTRSIPVLLRQYLKLGGKMLAFNEDADFGNVLDCLVMVDLHDLPLRMKNRYLSR